MFSEELKSINEAEEKAEQMRKDARAEAKALVDKAALEAQQKISAAEVQAKERYDSLVNQGLVSAQGKYEKAIHEAGSKAGKMAEEARKHQSEAVKFIRERLGS